MGKKFLRKKPGLLPTIFLLLALFFISSAVEASQDRVNVVVSISPQKYFVEQIGGEYVNVSVLLPPGASPHSFEPRPSQMVELGNADLYMAIGVEYEKALLPKIKPMHPDLNIVHTDSGISKISMVPHSDHHDNNQKHEHQDEHGHHHENHEHKDLASSYEHDHGDDGHSHDHGHHHHEGHDPHVWLSPDMVMIIAGNIYQALIETLPERTSYFQENYMDFKRELTLLDQDIKGIFSGVEPGTKFMVFHPAWGYFARSYGLVQVPIEIQGKEPSSADMKQLINTARHENIKVVFVSPQFSKRSAQVIAESIGGETVSINPLAEEWQENMLTAAEKFKQALAHGH